ncbi:Multiple epidermal growth factor-like domains protein 10, partial [Araneus ventricosus]
MRVFSVKINASLDFMDWIAQANVCVTFPIPTTVIPRQVSAAVCLDGKPGFYGLDCSSECLCNVSNTDYCDSETGLCSCLPGWEGVFCEEACSNRSWGEQCNETCLCSDDVPCHHVTGRCLCEPGFQGYNCSEECTPGFFGKDCEEVCPDCPIENTTCDHVTGWCDCPPGRTGRFCGKVCPRGTWGKKCSEPCICKFGECNPASGRCICPPGKTGNDCSLECPIGTFGLQCQQRCVCHNGGTCLLPSGMCKCMPGFRGAHCEETCRPGFYGDRCSKACKCGTGFICDSRTGCTKSAEILGLSNTHNDVFKMSVISAAILAIVIISIIVGCVICQKKRKKSKLELFALTNTSRSATGNQKAHCCSKMEESSCNGENDGNIYVGPDNGANDGYIYVGPDNGAANQYGVYENVEVKKGSTLSNVEFKFTDDADADAVYENTENHRRQLVDKSDLE